MELRVTNLRFASFGYLRENLENIPQVIWAVITQRIMAFSFLKPGSFHHIGFVLFAIVRDTSAYGVGILLPRCLQGRPTFFRSRFLALFPACRMYVNIP